MANIVADKEVRESVASTSSVEEKALSPFRQLYAGYAARAEDRARVAAGGIMTNLMVTALRTGMVDGVILSRPDFSENKLGYSIDIVTEPEKIASYGKSAYFNIQIEREWRRFESFGGKLAICALPCHTRIIRRMQQGGSRLQNVQLVGTLFCGHNNEIDLWDLILEKKGIPQDRIVDMRTNRQYMHGSIDFDMDDGSVEQVSFREFNLYRRLWLFSKDLCRHCDEHLGAGSDFSVGDIFVNEFLAKDIKHSALIVRTAAGEALVNAAVSSGSIALEGVQPGTIYAAQRSLIVTSGDNVSRYYANRLFKHKFKKPTEGNFRLRAFLVYSLYLANDKISRTKVGRWIFLKTPLIVLKAYIKIFNLLKAGLD